MSPTSIFQLHLLLGYLTWLLLFSRYLWPRLKLMDAVGAQRAIATLHSFRFFGLVFLLPGLVGPGLSPAFATYAAYGDLVTAVLAILVLVTSRFPPVFWPLVVVFNLVGAADIIIDYYHGVSGGLAAVSGQLGATYAIPIIYVPLLMITHVAAFRLLVRSSVAGSRNTGNYMSA